MSIYPKYKLLSEIEPDSGRLNGECTNEYRANITMVKGGWYFCTHQKLAFIPFSKAHTNKYYIVGQWKYIIYIQWHLS